MLRVLFSEFGQPSRVAKLVDSPEPGPPTAWEVTVQIEYFPINVADLAILSGNYGKLPRLPSGIGMEGVGRILAVGSSSGEWNIGDQVLLLANDNWLERKNVPTAAVHRLPMDLPLQQASMLKVNPTTALMLLKNHVELKEGDWIIQNAPLSSVGSCIMQLAKGMGFRTINIVRRPESIPRAMRLGGDIVLEESDDLIARIAKLTKNAPVRLALDAVGGESSQILADALQDGGTVVTYGMLSGKPCQLAPETFIFHGIKHSGFWLNKTLNRLSLAERSELFHQVTKFAQEGSIRIDVDSVHPIHEIAAALHRAEQGGRTGKVLVRADTSNS
jgi:trans-2-enoyl-CoA reductase